MENGCYWIAIPNHMARRDCDKTIINLYKSMLAPETEMLEPYVGTICPGCGKKIFIDERSYELVKA